MSYIGSSLSTNTVAISQIIASGTPSSTTYLRGDNTWATVSGGTLIPSGTAMIFAQTSAPTGFTKATTHNDKALRVVSGTAGSGGSVAFTTAFASQTPAGSLSINTSGLSAGATTLSTTQIPSHTHTVPASGSGESTGSITGRSDPPVGNNVTSSSTGGGGSHSHSISGSATGTFTGTAINLAVQYVDVIIATKD